MASTPQRGRVTDPYDAPEPTPAESPTAKRLRIMDTRLTPGIVPAVIRTDQGHRQLEADPAPIDLVVEYRQMALDNAALAAQCVEERQKTNDHLEKIHAHLKIGGHVRPPGYRLLVAVVIGLVAADSLIFLQLYRIMDLIEKLHHLTP